MKSFFYSVLFLFFVGFALPIFSQTPSGAEKVWYWFDGCHNGKMLGLEVLLDGKPVYRTEFRACLLERKITKSDIKAFYFSGGPTFQGEYHTRKAEKIEGNVWQAGADPDALLLGVSFKTRDQILLNTIHIARPDKITESKIDSGMMVRTFPLKTRR